MEELRKLKEKIEHYKKLRRVAYLACGLSLTSIWTGRGGENFIDVDYIDCCVEEGLRYLDHGRIRKIVHNLYGSKRKGKLIFITSTALCHLVKRYGQHFLSLPVAIGDFGATSAYQMVRKLTVTVLLGTIGPLYIAGGMGAIGIAFTLATMALRLAYMDLNKLPTSPIDETMPASQVKSRIADLPEVVTVNFRNKVKVPSIVQEKVECWLPGQAYGTPNWNIKPTEIPTAVDIASHGLEYEDVVNMKDVTGLERVDFSDILDLGQTKPSLSKSSKGKMVNFLDMFGDPVDIDESETWDASSITDSLPKKINFRI